MFGENILNKYYSTKYIMENLKELYLTITSIIEINKPLFNTKVKATDFLFNKDNFLFYNKLTGNKEEDFKKLFENNKEDYFNLLKNFNNNGGIISLNNKNSFFYNLFKKFYNSYNKPYFMSIFKSYNDIRNELLNSNNLSNNYGLLSIGSIIAYNIDNSNVSNKKENVNVVNDYSIYNLVTINNTLYKNTSSNNSSNNTKKNTSSNLLIEESNINYSNFYNKKNTLTPIYSDYIKNIKIIFDKMYDCMYNLTMTKTQVQTSLYDLLLLSIELDYYSLLFFYSYINFNTYTSILDTSIKINDFVFNHIKKYNNYLSEYLSWKSKFVNNKVNNNTQIDNQINKSLKFKETLNTYLKNYDATISIVDKKYEYITDDIKLSLASTKEMINLLTSNELTSNELTSN